MPDNLKLQLQIKYVSVENLELWEGNPRDNDEAVPEVMKSIQEFGFLNPVVIDEYNVVKAGNTRLKAAIKLGMKEIPTVRAEHLTDKQMTAFALADNKTHELAKWILPKVAQMVSLAELPTIPGFKKEDVDKISAFLLREGGAPAKPMAQGKYSTLITCPHCQQTFEGKLTKKGTKE